MVSNIYQKNIDVNNLEKKQRQKAVTGGGRNLMQNKIIHDTPMISDAALR